MEEDNDAGGGGEMRNEEVESDDDEEGRLFTEHDEADSASSLTLQGLELDNTKLDHKLAVLGVTIGGLPWSSLKLLNLSRNGITELPAAVFRHLPSLTALDVCRNRLRDLPAELGTLLQVKFFRAPSVLFL
jgi:Leucine-rich repeat (LRR) protein